MHALLHLFIFLYLRLEQFNDGASFETISAYGDHSAIVHYSPTPETNRKIERDNIYLIDSGGQYYDGTTDVTRSIHLGTPTDFQKKAFTLVLKGHLAINRDIFPKDTFGNHFDGLARAPLKAEAMNYGHGTGHGIGSYGDVHEYPPAIGTSSNSINLPFAENMFTSNGNFMFLTIKYLTNYYR